MISSFFKSKGQIRADYIGMFSSGLCLVHCLGLPLFLAFFSVNHTESHWVNFIFLFVCIIAVTLSARHQEYLSIKIAFYAFLSLLSIGILLEDWNPWLEVLSYIASLGLILTHASSIHYCRKCQENTSKTHS